MITSRAGAKSCITLDAKKREQLRVDLLTDDVRRIVTALKTTGVTREEALKLVDQYWDYE